MPVLCFSALLLWTYRLVFRDALERMDSMPARQLAAAHADEEILAAQQPACRPHIRFFSGPDTVARLGAAPASEGLYAAETALVCVAAFLCVIIPVALAVAMSPPSKPAALETRGAADPAFCLPIPPAGPATPASMPSLPPSPTSAPTPSPSPSDTVIRMGDTAPAVADIQKRLIPGLHGRRRAD